MVNDLTNKLQILCMRDIVFILPSENGLIAAKKKIKIQIHKLRNRDNTKVFVQRSMLAIDRQLLTYQTKHEQTCSPIQQTHTCLHCWRRK